MQDNELFELCKSVHEATEWDGTDKLIQKYHFKPTPEVVVNSKQSIQLIDAALKHNGSNVEWQAPLYTSDYLLEKLPLPLIYRGNDCAIELRRTKNDKYKWSANIRGSNGQDFKQIADTPLKALLKLTLELHKEGLLDAKDN